MSKILHQDDPQATEGSIEMSQGEYLEWKHRSAQILLRWSTDFDVLEAAQYVHEMSPGRASAAALRRRNGPLITENKDALLDATVAPSVVFYREDLAKVSFTWEAVEDDEFGEPHAELTVMTQYAALPDVASLIRATATAGIATPASDLIPRLSRSARWN